MPLIDRVIRHALQDGDVACRPWARPLNQRHADDEQQQYQQRPPDYQRTGLVTQQPSVDARVRTAALAGAA